jgi:hypothetical protein
LSTKLHKISRPISISNHPLDGSPRTSRGIPVLSLWRHQSCCHPCKVCYHSTKGSCTSSQATGRAIVDLVDCHCLAGVLYFVSLAIL